MTQCHASTSSKRALIMPTEARNFISFKLNSKHVGSYFPKMKSTGKVGGRPGKVPKAEVSVFVRREWRGRRDKITARGEGAG